MHNCFVEVNKMSFKKNVLRKGDQEKKKRKMRNQKPSRA